MTVLSGRDIVPFEASQLAAAQRTLERAFFDYPLMVYACPEPGAEPAGCAFHYNAILQQYVAIR